MPQPLRGEVWLVDLGMAAKVRPCLALSQPAELQDRALVTVVPHTTSGRGSRFEVNLPLRFLKPGVFDAQNLVTVPHGVFIRKLGQLSAAQMQQLEAAVLWWLGLGPQSQP